MKKQIKMWCTMALLPIAAWSATITGKVTDAGNGNAALAGVKVKLNTVGGGGGVTLDSTISNAQGNFTFTGVTNGFRQLQATLAGYQNGLGFLNITGDSTYTQNISMTPTGGGGPVGKVAGKVTNNSNASPIANALVILGRFGGGQNSLDSIRTNAQGMYTFDSVSVGNNYTMTVRITGFANMNRNGISVSANQTTTENFALVATSAIFSQAKGGMALRHQIKANGFLFSLSNRLYELNGRFAD